MRNKIIVLILTVFLVFCLAGCTFTGSKGYTKSTGGRLQSTMMQDLYYDTNTKIVYILLMKALEMLVTVIWLLIMHRMECLMFITYKPIA